MGLHATLSSKFQISIPKEIREREGWKAGQKLAFIPSDGGYRLVPVPDLKDLQGIARGASSENIRDRNDRY